jgi:hypothetical protein
LQLSNCLQKQVIFRKVSEFGEATVKRFIFYDSSNGGMLQSHSEAISEPVCTTEKSARSTLAGFT